MGGVNVQPISCEVLKTSKIVSEENLSVRTSRPVSYCPLFFSVGDDGVTAVTQLPPLLIGNACRAQGSRA